MHSQHKPILWCTNFVPYLVPVSNFRKIYNTKFRGNKLLHGVTVTAAAFSLLSASCVCLFEACQFHGPCTLNLSPLFGFAQGYLHTLF